MESSNIATANIDYPRGITFEEVWAALKETREAIKETDKIVKENAEIMKKTSLEVDKVTRQMGRLGNSFGELVEHLVLPNIEEKFNALGFAFTKSGPNVRVRNREDPNESFEIDVFLENGDFAIAVEVKSKPNDDDVKEHIDRMEKLRRYADKKDDRRKFHGAVAGAVMSDSIRKYVLKNGFYLIEQTGDTVKINVPEGFVPKEW